MGHVAAQDDKGEWGAVVVVMLFVVNGEMREDGFCPGSINEVLRRAQDDREEVGIVLDRGSGSLLTSRK